MSCVFKCLQLLLTNYTKRPSQIIVRAGGKEELVGPAVACRSSTEFNPPELVNDDVLAVHVPDRADKLAREETKGIDGAIVGVVRNQQSVAQLSKVRGRDSDSPGLVQWRTLHELPHELPVFLENVDEAAGPAGGTRKRHVDQTTDVLNAKRREARRQRAVGKRVDVGKGSVVHVDFVVGIVGGI